MSLAAAAAAAVMSVSAATLTVGRGGRYERPSQAAKAAKDGDTVVIAAGEYRGDVCAWRANDLTIRGAGIDKTVRQSICDITGFIKKMQYRIDMQSGLGEVEMEVWYL